MQKQASMSKLQQYTARVYTNGYESYPLSLKNQALKEMNELELFKFSDLRSPATNMNGNDFDLENT